MSSLSSFELICGQHQIGERFYQRWEQDAFQGPYLEAVMRIFTIFHPGVFTIIHSPLGSLFKFLPDFPPLWQPPSLRSLKRGERQLPIEGPKPQRGLLSTSRSEARAERREAGLILDGSPSGCYRSWI